MNNLSNKEKAFTLIELLMVIAIVGILAGLAVIGTLEATERAKIAKSQGFSEALRKSLLMNRVSEWKFDEISGSIVTDTVGTRNGTLVNSPTRKSGADCVSGGCLEFDGTTNSYVDMPDIAALPLFSLSAWVYNISGGDPRHSIVQSFWEVVGTQICFWSYNFPVAGQRWRCSNSGAVSYDRWTYIVTTWDGSVLKHYTDGKLYIDLYPTSGSSQTLTSIAGYSGRIFKGRLDEVRIYSQAFSALSVRNDYLAGLNQLLAKGGITEEEYQGRLAELDKDQDYAVNE